MSYVDFSFFSKYKKNIHEEFCARTFISNIRNRTHLFAPRPPHPQLDTRKYTDKHICI